MADGSTVGLTFGALQLKSKTDALGRMTQYGYDNFLNLQSVTDANGNAFTYSWSPTGNLLSITDPKNQVTSFEYDSADQKIRNEK